MNPKTRPHPAAPDQALSLIRVADERAAKLQRMREKLAGPSQASLKAQARQERNHKKTLWSWGWKAYLASSIIGLNIAIFGFGKDIQARLQARHAPAVPRPSAKLTPDEQALYWTYALYDFDKLRANYSVPAGAVLDAGTARARIEELRPKVGVRTRFIMDSYHPIRGRG